MANTLEQAQAAVKSGNKESGKKLLTKILRDEPRNETAWLWMAYIADSDEQRRECLERVLSINPDNKKAKQGLNELCPPPTTTPSKRPTSSNHTSPPPSALALVPADRISQPADSSQAKAISYEPGEEKKRRVGVFLPWWLILLILAAGIIYEADLIGRWNSLLQFSQAGVTDYGQVIETWTDPRNNHFVVYSFDVVEGEGNALSLQKEAQVDSTLYNSLEPGLLLRIQYLFDNPRVARLSNDSNFSYLGFLTVVILLVGGFGLWGAIRPLTGLVKYWPAGLLSRRAPPRPKIVWEGEGPPPIKQWAGAYTFGQDGYEESFVIETEDGVFLGEGGMEILTAIPNTEPKQVVAFDVGIFDKTDLTTLSGALMSEAAYHDESVRGQVEANPQAQTILAQPGATFTLESTAMRLEASVESVEYDSSEGNYFKELAVSLAIFVKEGVELNQPMAIPDQFK